MKFGILGTAGIGVKSVIPAVQASEHEAAAIASRDEARASAVADELGIPTAYGSYEALLADDSLDAVYIPLPNGLHADWVRAAADRGLHVLCEKPLTASADETAAVFDYCEDAGVTLMEAFMYRFHPLTERAAELVASELGAVVSVTSNFSFRLPDGADDIRIDPDLAGGSVMDVGCYAVSAARLFLGTPDRVYATTTDTRDCGVDTRMSGVLEYDSGATARVESSFDTPETQYYRVQTTDGWLEANPAFNVDPTAAAELTYATDGRVVTETFDPTDSYRREVEAFARAVETGETPRVDREESVSVMRTIDAIYESAETGAAVELD
ncbi:MULTISPECIES: D-xylose 1-dehydrogenase [Haloferax]|uniref:Gfo/Idh/MocA family oxidoreductase n=4 Tax=Haloferax TaxID=2251 RepID=A0A558GFC5_HALVO|nr:MULTISPECIES: D-xylose 1-dehydrogenase [Haloferax]ELK52370.1 xylose dehydrogenase (NADP) [Haloferax sp. BAB-2207]ELZ77507.1 xylose dehydrogenase (NADP) [Haloferax lucentense DSM 14919]ELZ95631.1 xylose dehydrogenase (NADP) [Haloferax alexandrinus JCM 10717]MBC9988258.1 Gfo/Idh/MocA family oxidoreductase [Haloferax sp. AS1]NLV03206.1 gfo/Idh/MocA family oxidoreductase [Haloferax alexandrinus]